VGFLVQNDIQQWAVDFDLAVVVNQAQFSKFVHKKAHAGARRTDHLRKRLLADLGDDWLKLTLVCTENLNPHVMVMKTAKDRVWIDWSDPIHWTHLPLGFSVILSGARQWPCLAMGIRDRPISPGSPWQNGYAERLIDTLRRECLDQVLIFGETHLRQVLT
jgi:transposase InsO family protein